MKSANICNTAAVRAPDLAGLLEEATDLSAIEDRRVLALLDEQNLSISARQLGHRLNYRLLAERLRSVAAAADLHLFTDLRENGRWFVQRLKRQGYTVHLKTIRHIRLADGGWRRDSNIDNLFAFWTGLFAAKAAYDVIVLGSGDYGLAGELAKAIGGVAAVKRPTVMTLSLPGSTAQALDARKNGHIKANLAIGLDVLKPLSYSIDRAGA